MNAKERKQLLKITKELNVGLDEIDKILDRMEKGSETEMQVSGDGPRILITKGHYA